jgi:hypothetical protein
MFAYLLNQCITFVRVHVVLLFAMHSIVQYNIKNVTVFYEYDFVSIYNDNLFETRVVNSGNNNSHMLGPI